MMLPVGGLLVVCYVFAVSGAHPDEVLDLPGLPSTPKFHHYSGYLNATRGRLLHYWFVESETSPSTAPLLLWLNGGPGCSSLDGFLTEHGPFRTKPKGQELTNNDHSWNKIANVLYLEAPAGVGFSYSADKDYKTDDDNVSLDNYVALQSFFKKFPEFSKNDFYITGESYGGIYVPTLSVRVLNGTAPINFKGFVVGNGMSSFPLNDNSLMFFVYYHGLIGIELWNKLTTHCCSGSVEQSTCNFHNNTDETCISAISEATAVVMSSGLNPYDLYDTCDPSSSLNRMSSTSRMNADFNNLFRKNKYMKSLFLNNANKQEKFNPKSNPPCINGDDITSYLNRPDVRKAIHIPNEVQSWTVCSDEVGGQYQILYQSMHAQYDFLLKKVRGLVYNGDVDMMCNFLGDQWFVDSLGRKVLSNYTYWNIGTQVGGFVKCFDKLDFVTIRGAGHMVPTNKPAEALQMITSFLNQKPY